MTNRTISKFSICALSVVLFLIALMLMTAFPHGYSVKDQTIEDFVSKTMKQWKSEYSSSPNLRVARVDVKFWASPKNFVKNEGMVISPIGVDIPKGQKIIKYAAYPPPLRELSVDGMKALAWAYPGRCRRNLHFVSLCLVKRIEKDHAPAPNAPTYSKLPKSYIDDALASAEELKEHNLYECAAFKKWPKTIAGDGTYIQQFKTIVTAIASGIIEEDDDHEPSDDICASMRKLKFSGHRAHVLSVMATRELGIPCFGFISASEKENYYVGTYSDQEGWIFFDFMNPKQGFIANPPVMLTQAPLIKEFDGCDHGCWFADAAAYGGNQWGISRFSGTEWGRKHKETDFTIAQTYLLDEWKK